MKTVKRVVLWFLNWNEFFTIPISLFIYAVAAYFIRKIDPTAGIFDLGVFQRPILAVIYFFIVHGAAWFTLKITFPKVFRYIEYHLENTINPKAGSEAVLTELTEWQKVCVSLSLFAFYLFALVFILAIV